ncbi:hypothetical protein [Chroococcidiopsis sp. TS-821]|uniref:hypothetical protein n=1 Tax=Chroococcidiopsis sp. TS-821 TaxID=1378066 RepID=UPI000CEE2E5E|nr:hypothetical protein [Chroococcidiopsis sp. TS-821]PPS41921.1 hypothetical protein B1A85_15680 [Chroococcidiopsis sp. TS-821]
MNNKKTAAAIASLIAVATTATPALANVTATKGNDGSVTVTGLNSYGTYLLEYSGTPRVRRVAANACGVVALRSSSSFPINTDSSFTKDGAAYEMSSLPVGSTPRCVDGNLAFSSAAPSASVFKDSNNVIYFTGLAPYSRQEITFNNVPSTRRAKANACGMISVKSSPSYPLASTPISVMPISASGSTGSEITRFTPSTMTSEELPFCRQGKAYFPEGWSGGSSNYTLAS